MEKYKYSTDLWNTPCHIQTSLGNAQTTAAADDAFDFWPFKMISHLAFLS